MEGGGGTSNAMMVEIVPAAPHPDPDAEQHQEEKDVTAHQVYSEEGAAAAAKIEEVLSKPQPFPAGPNRVLAAGDHGKRCLAFVETEQSIMVVFLRTLSLQHLDHAEMKQVLDYLFPGLRSIDNSLSEFHDHEVSLRFSRRKLLQRASGIIQFYRRISEWRNWLPSYMLSYYYIIESHFKYRHLLFTSSDLGLTPQLAEACALLPLVGMDRPAKKILRWFTQGNMGTSLRVMSIVGPVGIGKTTLVVEVRNRLIRHETSSGGRHYFHCNVMAQASWGADRNILLLHDILLQVSEQAGPALSSDESQCNNLQLLLSFVSKRLQHKRYFIIIDDLWEKTDWEKIKGAFPNNNLGSRILITTRVTSVAKACCSGSYDGLVHKMKPLNEIDSERLLQSKAVGYEDGFLPDNMKLFCDETLRRCDGIPLSIIGMAYWLKERLQQREDEDVEHQRFAMHYEEQVPQLPERLEQALSSAFTNFHNYDLRLLLLYMSMFPYGYKFEKDRLISKWKDEGLLNPGDAFASWKYGFAYQSWETEKIGECFFAELVDMNVITCVSSTCTHKQDEANVWQWQVNHLMQRSLASKSAEKGFIFTTTTLKLVGATAADRNNETSSRLPRKLALHRPDPLLPSLLETMDLSRTRSLSVSGTVSRIPLDKFVNLVLLDLEGWENLKNEDLLQVCRSKMFFLRYLSVRNTRVSKLPHDIKELRSLETLDVSNTQITELPLELFKLISLERLDLRGTWISQLPKQIVGLYMLTCLLVGGGEGTINAARVPNDVQRLHYLCTLATVDLTRHPASFVRALGHLQDLRVLAVTWSSKQSTDRDYCEALLSSIGKWEHLQYLTIHCGLGCSMEFLCSLKKYSLKHTPREAILKGREYSYRGPPRLLQKFKVTAGRFASVPPWIHGLEHLSFVQITVCNKQTTTDDLKILRDLAKLQCLILGLDFIPGQSIVIGNEGFRELQRFSLDCPMPWLTFETGAMPNLTYLQLKFCSVPASQICVPSRISNLRRLTEVALCYNAQYINSPSIKMTVDAVTKQVAEHCNPIDLLINGIEQDDVQEADDEVTEVTIGTSSRANAGAEDDGQAVVEEDTSAIKCEITEAES